MATADDHSAALRRRSAKLGVDDRDAAVAAKKAPPSVVPSSAALRDWPCTNPDHLGLCMEGHVHKDHVEPASAATAEIAFWPGCCRHLRMDHDQHGCTIDVSADRRVYWRCHDEDQPAVDPRWRDCHTLPDEWLYQRLVKRGPGKRGWRWWVTRVPWLWKLISRYAVNHFYCTKDGQCIFRNGHRGSCCWGNDDDE